MILAHFQKLLRRNLISITIDMMEYFNNIEWIIESRIPTTTPDVCGDDTYIEFVKFVQLYKDVTIQVGRNPYVH